MEERKATQIGATEAEINTLYGLYPIWTENEDIELNDFMEFIQSPSSDRELFLDQYCNYEIIDVGDTPILKFKLK